MSRNNPLVFAAALLATATAAFAQASAAHAQPGVAPRGITVVTRGADGALRETDRGLTESESGEREWSVPIWLAQERARGRIDCVVTSEAGFGWAGLDLADIGGPSFTHSGSLAARARVELNLTPRIALSSEGSWSRAGGERYPGTVYDSSVAVPVLVEFRVLDWRSLSAAVGLGIHDSSTSYRSDIGYTRFGFRGLVIEYIHFEQTIGAVTYGVSGQTLVGGSVSYRSEHAGAFIPAVDDHGDADLAMERLHAWVSIDLARNACLSIRYEQVSWRLPMTSASAPVMLSTGVDVPFHAVALDSAITCGLTLAF